MALLQVREYIQVALIYAAVCVQLISEFIAATGSGIPLAMQQSVQVGV